MSSINDFNVTDTSQELLAADIGRSGCVLEHISGDKVWFAFGTDAIDSKCISISTSKVNYEIPPSLVKQSVNVVCESGGSAVVSYSEV